MKKLKPLPLLLFAVLLAAFPQSCAAAAKDGLELFLSVVLPSLLPFFMVSSLLLASGALHALARLMQPLMRPLFRCPGDSAYVFALSVVSGYPVGARVAAQLVKEGRLTGEEAVRTLSFSSTSGPLFVLGAVASGMLNCPSCGPVLLLSHYAGAILTGLFFRLLPAKKQPDVSVAPIKAEASPTPFGLQLKNAVADSIKSIWLVGGYIVLFCVLIEILTFTGVLGFLGSLTAPLFSLLGFSQTLAAPFLSSLVEITAGCRAIAQANAPLVEKIILCCGAISWSGFAIHSQATAFLADARIKARPYLAQKVLHGAFSVVCCILLLQVFPASQTAFAPQSAQTSFLSRLGGSCFPVAFFLLATIILCASWVIKHKKHKKARAKH
jgi:sporulation integral membrane protein YlbJ